jgi:hypothetical protein
VYADLPPCKTHTVDTRGSLQGGVARSVRPARSWLTVTRRIMATTVKVHAPLPVRLGRCRGTLPHREGLASSTPLPARYILRTHGVSYRDGRACVPRWHAGAKLDRRASGRHLRWLITAHTPLRYRLLTPELQWHPRGQTAYLTGVVQTGNVWARAQYTVHMQCVSYREGWLIQCICTQPSLFDAPYTPTTLLTGRGVCQASSCGSTRTGCGCTAWPSSTR